MLIFCTGMVRSGSTWAFNVVKDLLTCKSSSNYTNYSENIKDIIDNQLTEYDNILIKCHQVDNFGRSIISHKCAKCIYTFRPPLEAITSFMQVFNKSFDEILEYIEILLSFMEFQSQYDVLWIEYNSIEENPELVIQKIADYIGVKATRNQINLINSKLSKENISKHAENLTLKKDEYSEFKNIVDVGFSYYHKDTLIHRNHIRKYPISANSFLTQEQIKMALNKLAKWVNNQGEYKHEVFGDKFKIGETQLQQIKNKLNQSEKQLQIAQMQIEELNQVLTAIESSKFWKLRRWWFHIKRKLNIGEKDTVYQNYVSSVIKQHLIGYSAPVDCANEISSNSTEI